MKQLSDMQIHELLASRKKIAVIWCVDDVQCVRPDLSDDQAWEVLKLVEKCHDCTCGITWDTLEITAESLFGDAPDAGEGRVA